MFTEKNEKRKKNAKFTVEEINLAVEMVDKIESTIEILYYLMEQEDEDSFVMLLLSLEEVNLYSLIAKQKRNTDILFEIDSEKSVYVVLCQDTQVDGGYHFAKRLVQNINETKENKNLYCIALEVRSSKLNIKTVIFKLIETFINAKQEKKSGEIIYRSLN